LVQFPTLPGKRNSSDGGPGSGDGASAAEGGEPDHDFVFIGAVGGGAGKEVIGDVCDDGGAGVGPFVDGFEGFDGGEGFLVDFCYDVGVGFDVAGTTDLGLVGSEECEGNGGALPAGPGPRGVPFECAAAEAVNAGALRAGCCIALAPEVVVDRVGAGNGAVKLATVVCALLNGGCRCCESKGSRAGDKERGELHDELVDRCSRE
jgi:hypothetical protein